MDHEDFIRERQLAFGNLSPDPCQAASALLVLSETPSVQLMQALDNSHLRIRYDVRDLDFATIEELLERRGFFLDNALLAKLKRAWFEYSDDTLRANLGIHPGGTTNNVRSVFLQDFDHHHHGCRDGRPRHWRQYF